jgi:hypothetical protein
MASGTMLTGLLLSTQHNNPVQNWPVPRADNLVIDIQFHSALKRIWPLISTDQVATIGAGLARCALARILFTSKQQAVCQIDLAVFERDTSSKVQMLAHSLRC